MSKWNNIDFQRLAKVQGGFAFKSDDYQVEGALLVRIGNLQKGIISFHNSVYIDTSINSYSDFKLNNGDILIGLTGDLGKLAKVKKNDLPALLNQRVGRFVLSDNTDSEFLYQLVSSEYFQEKLKVYFEGGAQANISPKQIESVYVYTTTSKPEQIRIAQILSKADAAITQTEALIAKYQRIKTGLMQDLLTKGIDENGNIRSEQTHRFKTENGLRVPEEWEVSSLENLTRSVITYGIVQAGPHVTEGIPYIRTGDMSGDFLSIENLLRTTKEIASRFQRSQVEVNDIVFALRATIGKVLIVPTELHGANLTQGTARIAPNMEKITPNYLLWTMRMFYFENQVLKIQKGTTFAEITLGELRKMIVSHPTDINEQSRISEIIEKQEATVQKYKSNLLKLQSLKTGLMLDLLSGKVRVTVKEQTLVNQ